jgi:hypothetical protein
MWVSGRVSREQPRLIQSAKTTKAQRALKIVAGINPWIRRVSRPIVKVFDGLLEEQARGYGLTRSLNQLNL